MPLSLVDSSTNVIHLWGVFLIVHRRKWLDYQVVHSCCNWVTWLLKWLKKKTVIPSTDLTSKYCQSFMLFLGSSIPKLAKDPNQKFYIGGGFSLSKEVAVARQMFVVKCLTNLYLSLLVEWKLYHNWCLQI